MDLAAVAAHALRPLLFAGWAAFGLVFLLRRAPPEGAGSARRDPQGWVGMGVQSAAFFLVWGLVRAPGAPLLPLLPDGLLLPLEFALILVSVWLVGAAVRTLGKQWAIGARVIVGHELVMRGPYALVRHPIYTALFGMLLATGIALSDWRALALAIPAYAFGTVLRVRAEERVLRATFGAAFDDYARRVPAFLPRVGKG